MPFSKDEKALLLSQKFVGEKVIQRLEEIGIDNFEKLSANDSENICKLIGAHLGVTCWGNSPMARQSIENSIAAAKNALK